MPNATLESKGPGTPNTAVRPTTVRNASTSSTEMYQSWVLSGCVATLQAFAPVRNSDSISEWRSASLSISGFDAADPVLLLAWAGQWTCPGKPVGLYGPLDPPDRAGPACTWSPCE